MNNMIKPNPAHQQPRQRLGKPRSPWSISRGGAAVIFGTAVAGALALYGMKDAFSLRQPMISPQQTSSCEGGTCRVLSPRETEYRNQVGADRALWERTFPENKELIDRAFELGILGEKYYEHTGQIVGTMVRYLATPESDIEGRAMQRTRVLTYLSAMVSFEEARLQGERPVFPHLFDTPPAVYFEHGNPLTESPSFANVDKVEVMKAGENGERSFTFTLHNQSNNSMQIVGIDVFATGARGDRVYHNQINFASRPGSEREVTLTNVPPAFPTDASSLASDIEAWRITIRYQYKQPSRNPLLRLFGVTSIEENIEVGELLLMPQNTTGDGIIGKNPPPNALELQDAARAGQE